MKNMLAVRLLACAALPCSALLAQDLTGTWQGTLQAGQDLRIQMKISKGDGGALKGAMYSLDQGAVSVPIASVTLQGSSVKMAIPGIGGAYEGKLNSDGNALEGTWTQGGGKPLPLNLKHVSDAEAWAIPAPPAQLKPMAANAVPVFEVATIKPSQPGTPGKYITLRGRDLATLNTSLYDLIAFAYDLHPRQITGGPAWLESDFYDILAQPEPEGRPNAQQIKTMIQKLLADRFKLKFHNDKKELSAYGIVVGKNGPKMTKNEGDPSGLPGLGFRGAGIMSVRNATMADFGNTLQAVVLDRPVVDQTGLTGRYDFELKWTPDAAQFGGRRAEGRRDDPDAPPDLFTAIQEQIGLQLKAVKAPVGVIVIDRVEKPSAN